MKVRRERTPEQIAEHYRRMAHHQRELADEFDASADQQDGRRSPGTPADGHTWRIAVSYRGSHGIVGQDGHRDAERFEQLPNWVEVRAWSLQQALAAAAGLPFDAFFDEEDD